MMKLIYAIKTLDETRGGAERVLRDVTSGLANKGHDVSVLTFDQKGGESFYPLNTKVKRIHVSIGDVTQRSNPLQTVKRILALRKTIMAEKPDAVVAFMHSMFIPIAFALAGTGIPVIASEHIVPDYYKNRKLEFALMVLASFLVKRITVLSEKVKSLYPPILQSRMDVMPNPVDDTDENADVLATQKRRKTILNVGRLDPQKDQESLIHAFALLAPHYPEWDLRIVGEGALRPQLEDLVDTYGLQDRIQLPGTTNMIGKEYQNAQIFAMSSKFEAFGLATVEAMAYGVPAVGYADCPGTNEVIKDQYNGLLVSGNNRAHAFSKGLEALMNNGALRRELGMNAKQSSTDYRPEKIVNSWEALIDTVKAGAANSPKARCFKRMGVPEQTQNPSHNTPHNKKVS